MKEDSRKERAAKRKSSEEGRWSAAEGKNTKGRRRKEDSGEIGRKAEIG
jgi:hypothetical protein